MTVEQLLNMAANTVAGFTPGDWMGFALMALVIASGLWFLYRAIYNACIDWDLRFHQNMAGFTLCVLVGSWIAYPMLIW